MLTGEDILLTKDIMKLLHYKRSTSLHGFINNPDNNFPKPFKIGRRNAWYPKDIEDWLESQRAKRYEDKQ